MGLSGVGMQGCQGSPRLITVVFDKADGASHGSKPPGENLLDKQLGHETFSRMKLTI
jgi:hypothetical protein